MARALHSMSNPSTAIPEACVRRNNSKQALAETSQFSLVTTTRLALKPSGKSRGGSSSDSPSAKHVLWAASSTNTDAGPSVSWRNFLSHSSCRCSTPAQRVPTNGVPKGKSAGGRGCITQNVASKRQHTIHDVEILNSMPRLDTHWVTTQPHDERTWIRGKP